jgi:hypothetical protein
MYKSEIRNIKKWNFLLGSSVLPSSEPACLWLAKLQIDRMEEMLILDVVIHTVYKTKILPVVLYGCET